MQSPPFPRYLVPPRFKYSPQQTFLLKNIKICNHWLRRRLKNNDTCKFTSITPAFWNISRSSFIHLNECWNTAVKQTMTLIIPLPSRFAIRYGHIGSHWTTVIFSLLYRVVQRQNGRKHSFKACHNNVINCWVPKSYVMDKRVSNDNDSRKINFSEFQAPSGRHDATSVLKTHKC